MVKSEDGKKPRMKDPKSIIKANVFYQERKNHSSPLKEKEQNKIK